MLGSEESSGIYSHDSPNAWALTTQPASTTLRTYCSAYRCCLVLSILSLTSLGLVAGLGLGIPAWRAVLNDEEFWDPLGLAPDDDQHWIADENPLLSAVSITLGSCLIELAAIILLVEYGNPGFICACWQALCACFYSSNGRNPQIEEWECPPQNNPLHRKHHGNSNGFGAVGSSAEFDWIGAASPNDGDPEVGYGTIGSGHDSREARVAEAATGDSEWDRAGQPGAHTWGDDEYYQYNAMGKASAGHMLPSTKGSSGLVEGSIAHVRQVFLQGTRMDQSKVSGLHIGG